MGYLDYLLSLEHWTRLEFEITSSRLYSQLLFFSIDDCPTLFSLEIFLRLLQQFNPELLVIRYLKHSLFNIGLVGVRDNECDTLFSTVVVFL